MRQTSIAPRIQIAKQRGLRRMVNQLIDDMQCERPPRRVTVVTRCWSDGLLEGLIAYRGELVTPKPVRRFHLRKRGHSRLGAKLPSRRRTSRPRTGPHPTSRPRTSPPRTGPQRDPIISRRLPAPFLVAEALHPRPEPLPDVTEQIKNVVT